MGTCKVTFSSVKLIIVATEKATVTMVTSLQHSNVECEMEKHRGALHREAQKRYRQARSVRETAKQKRECLSRKKTCGRKEGLKLVTTRLKTKIIHKHF